MNNDISKLYKLKQKYLKMHKNIKKNNKNSQLIFKHIIHFYKIIKIKEYSKDIMYEVKSHSTNYNWTFKLDIPLKYKKLDPIPFTIDIDINIGLYRGAFLLSNNKIYAERFNRTPKIYKNLEFFIKEIWSERCIENRYLKKVTPFYYCKDCMINKPKITELEMFYDILSYKIAKSKGYNVICCKSKDNSARIIQKYVLRWLYSAPNGYFFKKGVNELKEIEFLN